MQIYCLTFWCSVANYDLQVWTCHHSCHGTGTEAMDSSSDREHSAVRCVITFGIVLKLEASWKVIYSTLVFTRVLPVMLSITLGITCRPEISIHMHVSSIDATKFKCQKEKCQGHMLVQIFCCGKRVLNCTLWGHLCADFSPLSSFIHIKISFIPKNIYLESSF